VTCAAAREFLGAHFDGELDPNVEFEIRAHVAACESCTSTLDAYQKRRTMLRESELFYQAPATLEARIRKGLSNQRRSVPPWQRWGAVAACLLIACGLGQRLLQHESLTRAGQQAISAHVRAMITGHVSDVVSTDRHTVKPWYNGRLDFSPPVLDLQAQGFPLVGGRIDYLDGKPVAALVYQRRKHVIDLFVAPGTSPRAENTELNGFRSRSWTQDGMSFTAVSDLNESELKTFQSLLQTQAR
jgi:anti-sigma factor RsiW